MSPSSDCVQIRSIISISAGDALQTEMVINCDIIPRLAVLSRSPNVNIRANAFLMYVVFSCHISALKCLQRVEHRRRNKTSNRTVAL